MQRLFVPTSGPGDWRRSLANPERQWVRGRSAFELAVAWEASRGSDRGLPTDVAALLDTVPDLMGATLLLGVPEHQVRLSGGGHSSQTDLWALLSSSIGLVSMAVEAKAGESFDRTVGEWLADASVGSGKPARLPQLREVLGLADIELDPMRYQLLHRAASAVIEAKRFGAAAALFLVQSFAKGSDSRSAFQSFVNAVGCKCDPGAITKATSCVLPSLYIGWLDCAVADSTLAAQAL